LNTGRSTWRETAFVTLVLRANPGLRILEDYERIAKRLECEQRKRGIRYRMCNVCYISAYEIEGSKEEEGGEHDGLRTFTARGGEPVEPGV
ncbi:MAG: hypothetical protein LBB61_07460, partial [Treponema sp.]|nr:hypothetical protein [Treponema sp.]